MNIIRYPNENVWLNNLIHLIIICWSLTTERRADRIFLMVDFFVASTVQTHKFAESGHEIGHYHLGRLRRLRVVVGGRHSPGSHLLRQDLTVAPPQLLLYLTSSAGSRIQSSIWMSSMVGKHSSGVRRHRTARIP